MNSFGFLLLPFLAFCSAASDFAFASNCTLQSNEEKALGDIARTLGKNDNYTAYSYNSTTPENEQSYDNTVWCNCSYAGNTVCHITHIYFKGQGLQGTLPPELTNLSYLQEIDLTRNYLNGTIPRGWGSSLNLVHISLLGNRFTGTIPVELTNIPTLQSLVLESNQFSGNLPQELGNFANISRLFLSSNNFTGELPETLAKLTTLTDFRISDNQFSGQIPNFIQNWTKLTKLQIQGSDLSGPIPSEISYLKNLEDLRISDLNGSDSTFPRLDNMTKLKTLILRSCNIHGSIPDYFNKLTNLKTLDLSFNKLTGEVPETLFSEGTRYVFLTGNLLNRTVPKGLLDKYNKVEAVDLSYNNFSTENTVQDTCQDDKVNLFASSSVGGNSSGLVSCRKIIDNCKQKSHSFHINCGGSQVTRGDITYDIDKDTAGVAKFFDSRENWVFSSTGVFMDEEHTPHTTSNSSEISMPNDDDLIDLYMNARLSPISLTYYGFCLINGNYTVQLHFAEIMFIDDKNYSSLGRRIFDVYIQGTRVWKDFNIEKEAGGVGKPFILNFTRIPVTNNELEIRLQWAGKGTTAIPKRSVYGPLISAISVESDNPPKNGSSNISDGAIIGIVAAGVIIIILVFVILREKGFLKKKSSLAREVKALDLQTGFFSLRQIKVATNNFDVANKIGEGGFGPVYKGVMSDGTIIAVKQLSSKSRQGNREFLNEIGMISALQHPCLVKLYGCGVEGDQLLLIYEYMENNSLARALFGPRECQIKLDWPTRHKICVGIARGLTYLHEESRLKIVHRDIKATNVLLDRDLNPKISDFGLAKLDEDDNTHMSTRIAGTYGYMAPEYAMHGYLTDKADVYSFGIVTLEIISGRANTIHGSKNQSIYLLDWAHLLKEKGNLMELVDKRLGSDFNEEEATVMIKVALLCTDVTATLRPAMSSVLSMLEGRAVVPEPVAESSEVLDEKKLEAMRMYYQQIEENNEIEVQEQSASMDGPWTASSSSAADLYPVHLDSSYWEKRN